MKKTRVRKGSIAEKAVHAVEVLDRPLPSMILFSIFIAAMMIGGAMIYNTVVPMYQ